MALTRDEIKADILKYVLDSNTLERFWNKVQKSAPDECWAWTGTSCPRGYGRFNIKGPVMCGSHVVSWMIYNKRETGGLCVCHSCDVPSCVNPNHLWLGTHLDNSKDCISKGRNRHLSGDDVWSRKFPEKLARGDKHGTHTHPETVRRGSRHYCARFDEKTILEIRSRYLSGELSVDLAAYYKVHHGTIHKIVKYKTWKHLGQYVTVPEPPQAGGEQ